MSERTHFSDAQMRALRDLQRGNRYFGGTRSTWKALADRGLVAGTLTTAVLTDKGRAVLVEIDKDGAL